MKPETNKLYEYIIIGGSKDGFEVLDLLTKNNISALLIDEKGKTSGELVSYKARGVLFTYRRGIIYVDTVYNGEIRTYCCTNLIIATGDTSDKLNALEKQYKITNNIFYGEIPNLEKIEKNNCVILGDSTEALEAAINLSKDFKSVYLCKKSFNSGSKKLLKVIEEIKNISIINGGEVVDFTYETAWANVIKANKLIFSSYAELPCDVVIAYTDRCPDTLKFETRLIQKDENNYCIVDDNYQSKVVPNVYAIGHTIRGYKRLKFLKILREQIIKK